MCQEPRLSLRFTLERCLKTPNERTSGKSVKRRMVFHGRPQNDWCSLILALRSLWKSCGKSRLSAGLNPRSKPLMNRIARKQQLQFALACVVVCRGHNGHQVASAVVTCKPESWMKRSTRVLRTALWKSINSLSSFSESDCALTLASKACLHASSSPE